MIPYNKMSKRQQKNEDAKRRNVWTVNPVTKVIPNKKDKLVEKELDKELNNK